MRQYLAIACKLITDSTWSTPWELHSQLFALDNYVRSGRLLRSQSFGDNDYPDCVLSTLNNILSNEGEEKTKAFVDYVLNDVLENATPEFKDRNQYFINLLNNQTDLSRIEGLQITFNKFINLSECPDDFYRDLQSEINRAYNFGLFSVIPFLIRKFIENLIIDILRKKYTTREIHIYYDTSNHKCHNFSTIVSNFESKLHDFQTLDRNLNSDFIRRINSYREKGNATAHSISLKLTQAEINEIKESSEDVEYILKLLIRVLNLIN